MNSRMCTLMVALVGTFAFTACGPSPTIEGEVCFQGECFEITTPPKSCETDEECQNGNVCDGLELCFEGECVPGTPPSCLDNDVCNGNEECHPKKGCVNGIPLLCDNRDPCDGTEFCDSQNGCMGGEPLECNDGEFCNGEETCEEGVGCVDGDDPCMSLEVCDEETDECGECQTDDECSDGDACNGVELCVDNFCEPGDPLLCDDLDLCNGFEPCDPVDGCQPSINPIEFDPGNVCIGQFSCDSTTGEIVLITPALVCNDGEFCNGVETCSVGDGCVPGTPPSCDDGNVCNGVEVCDEGSDQCAPGVPVDCDDGLFCNGEETCHPENGCQLGANPCFAQPFCDEDTDTCFGCSLDAQCDDGLFCNGVETCDNAVGGTNLCLPGDPVDCGGDACEDCVCNEDLQLCECTDIVCPDDDFACTEPVCVNGNCLLDFDQPFCQDRCFDIGESSNMPTQGCAAIATASCNIQCTADCDDNEDCFKVCFEECTDGFVCQFGVTFSCSGICTGVQPSDAAGCQCFCFPLCDGCPNGDEFSWMTVGDDLWNECVNGGPMGPWLDVSDCLNHVEGWAGECYSICEGINGHVDRCRKYMTDRVYSLESLCFDLPTE